MKNLGKFTLLCSFVLLAGEPSVTLVVDKTTSFKGEAIKGVVRYMIPKDTSAPQTSSTISWSEPFIDLQRFDETNATHYYGERHFLFYPTKGDTFRVAPTLKIGLGQNNDQSYQRFKDISAFDNAKEKVLKPKECVIALKNQPSDFTPYVGDFTLSSKVDATTIKPREPLHFTVTLQGEGAIDAFLLPKLDINNTTVVGEIITNETTYTDQRKGKKVFDFTLTSEQNFTIPSLKWRVFNPKTMITSTLQTPPFVINVTAKPSTQITFEHHDEGFLMPHTLFNNILYFIMGGVSVLCTFFISSYVRRKKKKIKTFEEEFLRTRDQKRLLSLLLPYIHHPSINAIVHDLEASLYEGKEKIKLNKKEILDLLKEIKKEK